MKKHLFLALAVLSLSLNVKADDFRAPFLDESLTSSPDYVSWIHEPPSLIGGNFADDFYYYQWGLVQRTITGVSEMAIYDESAPLIDVFSSVIGIQLSPEATPEIVKLCERATTEAYQEQLKKARAEYERIKGSTRVSTPKASAATSTAAIYDMQGRQLNAEPNRRLYIHNGQKYIRK